MKSGQIPNSAITATSSLNQYFGPERARLETVKSGSYAGAWIPKANDQGQWIQVDLGKITKITRVGIQGRQDASQWVKSYSLTYSVEGGPFLPYSGGHVSTLYLTHDVLLSVWFPKLKNTIVLSRYVSRDGTALNALASRQIKMTRVVESSFKFCWWFFSLCCERLFPGMCGFPSPLKPTFQVPFDLEIVPSFLGTLRRPRAYQFLVLNNCQLSSTK